jgi:hypothetical protein
VEESYSELEVGVEMVMVVVGNGILVVVVEESYSELEVGVEMVMVVVGNGILVEVEKCILVEVVGVKEMVVASDELVVEVMAKVAVVDALRMVVVVEVEEEGEVVLYKVVVVVGVLYKEVGMVEVVNGLGEVVNIQALEAVAVIDRDKLVVVVNVEVGAVSEVVAVVNVEVEVVNVVVEVVNYSSMV